MARLMGGTAGGTIGEPFNRPLTAHFIGGCTIGDSPETGVVDPYHRVYGHPGLHVVDGSAISANLGVNPSLTITAQAERAMAFWPNKGEADARPALGAAYQPMAPVAPASPGRPGRRSRRRCGCPSSASADPCPTPTQLGRLLPRPRNPLRSLSLSQRVRRSCSLPGRAPQSRHRPTDAWTIRARPTLPPRPGPDAFAGTAPARPPRALRSRSVLITADCRRRTARGGADASIGCGHDRTHVEHDLVLVVDFGAQYAQLIARRVREARVYSEIVPHTMPVAEMLAKQAEGDHPLRRAVVGVRRGRARHRQPTSSRPAYPVFGMCYGFQLMARGPRRRGRPHRRPRVRPHRRSRSPSPAPCSPSIPAEHTVWMSHGDSVTAAPAGFDVLASTDGHAGGRVRGRRPRRWPACSGTPRCCTPSTARRCSSTSCTTSPAAGRPGRWSTSSRSRSSGSATRSATAARRSAACPAASTPRSRPRSCSAPSATG